MTTTTSSRSVDAGPREPTATTSVPPLVLDLLTRITGDEKHDPASHSTLDVLWVLHRDVLDVAPDRTTDPDRDRFLLSKGHGPASYYAVLSALGFVEPTRLDRVGAWDSVLGHHPDRALVPGVEIGSGSLGHGLALAVGTALGLRAQQRRRPRVVVLVGDGELDEGSNAEAIALAGRLGLARLTCVVVDNGSATHGWPGGLGARFALEGWDVADVDGHDHDALRSAFGTTSPDRPRAVIAHTHARTPGEPR